MVEKAVCKRNFRFIKTNQYIFYIQSWSIKLTKYGHNILCKVGLLKNNRDKCRKYRKDRKDRKLIGENKDDILM